MDGRTDRPTDRHLRIYASIQKAHRERERERERERDSVRKENGRERETETEGRRGEMEGAERKSTVSTETRGKT